MLVGLEEDLGGRLVAAAAEGQLDGPVQIGVRVRQLLGERERVAGLDEHMEAPGLDLLALRQCVFDRLGHRGAFSFSPRRTLPAKVGPQSAARAVVSSIRRASSWSRESRTARSDSASP